MIDALLGPLGGILGGVVALVVALVFGRYTGSRDANTKRDAQDARDYIKERGRQDEMDVGLGATDDERIRMLERVRDRSGAGKN